MADNSKSGSHSRAGDGRLNSDPENLDPAVPESGKSSLPIESVGGGILHRILNSLTDGIIIYNSEGVVLSCNDKYRDYYPQIFDQIVPGVRLESLLRAIAKTNHLIGEDADTDKWVEERLKLRLDPSGIAEEHFIDGRWWRFHEYKAEDGTVISQRRDVSKLREQKNALAESENRVVAAQEQLIAAIGSISDGFILYDADDRFVLCNQKYRDMMPEVRQYLVPGQTYEALVRGSEKYSLAGESKEKIAAWIEERLERHRNPGEPEERLFGDGRWTRLSDFRTPSGDYVGLRTDISSLKKTEEALQVSETRYRKLIEMAPDLITVLNDGVIALINNAGVKILGAKGADILIGQAFDTFVHPDYQELVKNNLESKADDGSWIPLKLVRLGGAIIDAELAVFPFDQSVASSVMVVARDTTERKRAAEALLNREERLRGVMNTVVDGIISIDEKGIIDLFNAAAEKDFGYSADEVIGKNINVLMPDPYRGEHDSYMTRYLRTGDARIIGVGREVLGRRKDGSIFPIDLAVSELRRDGHSHFIGVVRDITERKEAEAVLRESEERYALALDGTHEVLWDWDIDKEKLYISPRVQEILGIEAVSWVDPQSWLDHIHPDDLVAYREAIITHLKGKSDFFQFECRLLDTGKGGTRWCQVRGVALRNSEGRAYRMAGSLGEITERKKNEEKLIETMEKAEVASRVKTDFLANMSHELRTPLNAIIGFSEMIQEGIFGELGNAQYDEYIENINESGRHLLEIINDILDIARIEAGTMDLESGKVDVAVVIDSSLRLIGERSERAEIAIRRSVAKNLPFLKSEPRRLKQILLNLLSNAIKFTPKGGQVMLRAKMLKSGSLKVSVSDTGIGMSAEEIKVALSPFGQVDSRLTRKHQGTGLGLPLTKAFVELHSGTMEVRSKPGQGTTVTVCFPKERLMAKPD